MSGSAPSGRGRLFSQFQCDKCQGHEAYRSRPRGFFEKHLLSFLLLKPVRCEHCYHRVYVFRTVPTVERAADSGKPAQRQSAVSTPGQRVA